MVGESLLMLAAAAGRAVVDVAATDTGETTERQFAQLFGGGDADQTQRAGQWLKETREQLVNAAAADRELIRTALAGLWTGRWADVLDNHPDIEPALLALLASQGALPAAASNGDLSSY